MPRCEVLVTIDMGNTLKERHLQQISQVDPRVRVRTAWKPYLALWKRSKGLEAGPTPEEETELNQMLADTEVLFTIYALPDLLKRCPRLRWVQTGSHGVDHLWESGLLESPVVVTCARGTYAGPMAEFVLCMMLLLAKQGRRLIANQERRNWEVFTMEELSGKTVGIIGLGSIGQAVAKLCHALGMRVMATKRSLASWDANLAPVAELIPLQDLNRLLDASDFVVPCVPLTPETQGMLGEAQLRAMKRTAFLINISRGMVIQEPALVRALKEGWIAGAGLDVFQQEPLPKESELWEMPNVILSPHMAPVTDRQGDRATEAFCDNLRRFMRGEPLLHVVDRRRGY